MDNPKGKGKRRRSSEYPITPFPPLPPLFPPDPYPSYFDLPQPISDHQFSSGSALQGGDMLWFPPLDSFHSMETPPQENMLRSRSAPRASTSRRLPDDDPGPSTSASPPSATELDDLTITEEKRRRNTEASARFRLKKKQRNLNLERTISDLTGRAEELEKQAEELRRENGWLKEIVIMKSSSRRADPDLGAADIEESTEEASSDAKRRVTTKKSNDKGKRKEER